MNCCDRCEHVCRESNNPYGWTCMLFPQNRPNPIAGGEMPPYHRCREILRLTMPNDHTPCTFFKALPETGEMKVSEGRGEKSVVFKKRADAPDSSDTTAIKET